MRRSAHVVLAAACLLGLTAPVPAASATRSSTSTTRSVVTIAAAVHPVVVRSLSPASAAHAPPIPGARRYNGKVGANATQVIVVTARSWRSTVGWLRAYSRTPTGWKLAGTARARLGSGGLVLASRRVQSTGTTPAGLFAITETFGRHANPGTAMPYTDINDDHWWVEDRRSAYYNQLRLGRLGGFARRTTGYNASEHLARMGSQYEFAAVIDFNRPSPVIGRGAGIFLHAYGDRTTAGCVSVPILQMRGFLRWLSPQGHPRIIIGEDGWLATTPT
jgi:L,D-peptidoglycan transpeptidase YkuD (ErfK/YbiS/YcfS/YnhG family)